MIHHENFEKVLLVIALVAVIGLVVYNFSKTEERNILTVSGTHEMEVAPDQGVIVFQVVTREATAGTASVSNRELMNKVMAELEAQGIDDSDVETTAVYLNKVTEWENNSIVEKGYEQQTTVKVTVNDLTKVGSVLDAAISGGANSIQSVEFKLKPESETAYKQEALVKATEVAKTKAQTLVNAAGARLGKITSLSESSYVPSIRYNSYDYVVKESAGMAPTPISPELVSLSVTVNINYEIK